MTIKKKSSRRKHEIDLSGPEGNSFCLLGICKGYAKQLGIDWGPIQADAMSGDYEHLLKVLDKHFGSVVDFIR